LSFLYESYSLTERNNRLERIVVSREKLKPATARPSASLLMVRDGVDGVEVLVVRRNPSLRVSGGFLVYPGGVLDETDLQMSSSGCELEPYRINAIRETFEEIGVLYGSGNGDLELGRTKLLSGEMLFSDFFVDAQLGVCRT